MNIYLSKELILIWSVIFLFELAYTYSGWIKLKQKMQKNEMAMIIFHSIKQSPSYAKIQKLIYNPFIIIIGLIVFAIICPILFPLAIFSILKKLIGYKTKLEIEAEQQLKAMEESKRQSEEFIKNEGVQMDDRNFNPDEPIISEEKEDENQN